MQQQRQLVEGYILVLIKVVAWRTSTQARIEKEKTPLSQMPPPPSTAPPP